MGALVKVIGYKSNNYKQACFVFFSSFWGYIVIVIYGENKYSATKAGNWSFFLFSYSSKFEWAGPLGHF